MKRWLEWLPLSAGLLWLLVDGRRFFLDDAQFLLEIVVITFLTRSVGLRLALTTLAWGMGVVAPLVVLAGATLSAAGIGMTSGAGNGVIVPVLEEIAKLAPVAIAAILARRSKRWLLNPTDLLLLGCMSGAGFSMIESSYFDNVYTGARYAPQIAGLNWLPAAWGSGGYIGHAAGTGFVTVCFGLGLYLKRLDRAARWWWAVPAGALGWITLEHGLSNLYITSGSRILLALGAGRLTPWLFLAAVAGALVIDGRNAAAVLRRSPELRQRRVMIRAYLTKQWRTRQWPRGRALIAIARELRWLNLTAWFDLERPAPPPMEAVR